MSFLRWPKLDLGTPLGVLVDKVNTFMRANDAVFTGGDRAHGSIDSDLALTTSVKGSATIAGKPAGGVAATYSVAFMETFETVPTDWVTLSGVPNASVVNTGQTGGKAIRQTGPVAQRFPWSPIPYDASKLYRLRARARRLSGGGTFSYGLEAVDAAGTVLGTYALCALAATPGSGWTDYTGWVKGLGATTAPAPDPTAPSALPVGTVAIRPYYALNTGAPGGVMELDLVDFDRQDEEAHDRTYNALLSPNDPADAARYVTGARFVPDAVDSKAIQTNVVITGAVVSQDDPSIFLDLRTGLAPTDPVFQHPGFVLLFNGNAYFMGDISGASGVFSGTVAASTFTAATATFNGTLACDRLTVAKNATFIGSVPAPTTFQGPVRFQGVSNIEVFASDLWVRSNSTAQFDCVPSFAAGLGAASASSLSVSGTLSAGTFNPTNINATTISASSSVSAPVGIFGTVTQSSGAVAITGSRTSNVDAILQEILTVLSLRGFVNNFTTP